MKALLLAAGLAGASILPAGAFELPTINPEFNTEVKSWGYRQCRKMGGRWGRYVCYNTTRTNNLNIAGILPTGITWTKERTHRIDCLVPLKARRSESLRGQVAAAYCPQLPGLAPAPFLSLTD